MVFDGVRLSPRRTITISGFSYPVDEFSPLSRMWFPVMRETVVHNDQNEIVERIPKKIYFQSPADYYATIRPPPFQDEGEDDDEFAKRYNAWRTGERGFVEKHTEWQAERTNIVRSPSEYMKKCSLSRYQPKVDSVV